MSSAGERAEDAEEALDRIAGGAMTEDYEVAIEGHSFLGAKTDCLWLEARLCALQEAIDAMVIWSGEPMYRTADGVPMSMPESVRRVVRKVER